MHVDGFRFDLAVALAKGMHDVEGRTFAGIHEQTIPKDVDKSKYSLTDPVSCPLNQPDGAVIDLASRFDPRLGSAVFWLLMILPPATRGREA